MDLLGHPTRVVRTRASRAVQAGAAALSLLAVTGAGSWPFVGGWASAGEDAERLVVAERPRAPEPAVSGRRADVGRRPVLPPPTALPVSATASTSLVVVPGPSATAAAPLPVTQGAERAMAAYRSAADALGREQPGCRLPWALLAGIGQVESGHGTVHGSQLDADGRAAPPILGPPLDGNGFALITDTDGGVFDGDPVLDRAVGPMQFIPSTWARWGPDADGDGARDPQDVDDAALAAGRYLCASGGRLDGPDGLIRAVFSYNHSYDYVRLVLTLTAGYLGVAPSALGVDTLPAPAPVPSPSPSPTPAPAEEPVVLAAGPPPAPTADATAPASSGQASSGPPAASGPRPSGPAPESPSPAAPSPAPSGGTPAPGEPSEPSPTPCADCPTEASPSPSPSPAATAAPVPDPADGGGGS